MHKSWRDLYYALTFFFVSLFSSTYIILRQAGRKSSRELEEIYNIYFIYIYILSIRI